MVRCPIFQGDDGMNVFMRMAAAALLLVGLAGCNPAGPGDEPPFESVDLRVGTGAEAVNGKIVVVDYVGWFYDPSRAENKGQVFDTSLNRPEPFAFVLGTGGVIRGWDQGVVGMKVGGVRRLIIPSSLGYGGQGVGVIPPYSTLLFEIELLEVR
jgi:FKBP-type peptidyl-prolyl cis-trans isomerase FkpA